MTVNLSEVSTLEDFRKFLEDNIDKLEEEGIYVNVYLDEIPPKAIIPLSVFMFTTKYGMPIVRIPKAIAEKFKIRILSEK